MKTLKMIGTIVAALAAISVLSGCGNVVDIPAGHVGKVLATTGWEKGIHEAGQVDIGTKGNSGECNNLVICEATSVTIKESFGKGTAKDGEDHRIITKNKVPLTVDWYVQVMLPDDLKTRDSIFATVTPVIMPNTDGRVSKITLNDVYSRFAQMTIRGKMREIFSRLVSLVLRFKFIHSFFNLFRDRRTHGGYFICCFIKNFCVGHAFKLSNNFFSRFSGFEFHVFAYT